MKRFKQTAVAAFTALALLQGAAHAQAVMITDVSASGNRITVKMVNNTEKETIFSISVVKQQDGLHRNLATRAVRQQNVDAYEDLTISFLIPDEKNGVDGSGTYLIKVYSADGEKSQQTFAYADTGDVAAFLQALKIEDAKISEENSAEDLLLPVIVAEENKGALFSLGVDRDALIGMSVAIQKDTARLLHQDGLADIEVNRFASALKTSFGLASFNNGEEKAGIVIMKPVYRGEAVNHDLLDDTISRMAERYETALAFETGFKSAYGLVLINHADTSTLSDALAAFRDETGFCAEEINKVEGLFPAQKYEAYRTIVLRLASDKAETPTELATVLDDAYNGAINSGGNQGGSGGFGGGGGGTAGNKDRTESGSVSIPQGSGTADVKPEIVFADLKGDHWAAAAVRALKDKGVLSGTDTGVFEPDRAVFREEFTKMIVLAGGFTLGNTTEFIDTEADSWYAPYLGAAVENGIVIGLEDGRFGVGMNITRQDMAVMVMRSLKANGVTLSKIKEYQPFADEAEIADYAKDAVIALFEAGIINGKNANVFDPMGMATRAEAAKIIYEACKGV